jgi:hypothetical protein
MERCDTTASSFVAKVWNEVFAHLHAVVVKCESSTRNWLFGLSGRVLSELPPSYQGNDEDALDVTLHLSLLLRSSSYARVRLVLSSPKACQISARVCRTLSDPSQNRITPDTTILLSNAVSRYFYCCWDGSTVPESMNSSMVCWTASVVQWSDFLAEVPEIPGSITGDARCSE